MARRAIRIVGNMTAFKAALIDLDGFLINSEDIGYEVSKIYFKQFGLENFTPEEYKKSIGIRSKEEIQRYTDDGLIKTDLSVEELAKQRSELSRPMATKKLKLMPGVLEFLKLTHENYKTALVTSSGRSYVDFVFGIFDLGKYFDEIVTGDMVTLGKPNPEPYLVAANKLFFEPKDCVVFEDAPNGVLAGKAAGMTVIAVPSRFVVGDEVFEKADQVFGDLDEASRWLDLRFRI